MAEINQKNQRTTGNGSSIKLSAPWGRERNICNVAYIPEELSSDVHNNFLKERTRLHEIYILEQARNKRIGLVLAFLLILSASATVLFAPTGRETLSYWVGAALIIFAAGSAGFGRVWGKAANISFGADQDQRNL